jgi:hypothetical protein
VERDVVAAGRLEASYVPRVVDLPVARGQCEAACHVAAPNDNMTPAPLEALREWKVSPRLNRTGVGDNDPTIIEPIKAA